MHSSFLRRPLSASPSDAAALVPAMPFGGHAGRIRRGSDLAPLAAALLLTAAIFVLPTAGQRQGTGFAAVDDIAVSATHISYGAAQRSAAHE